MVRECNIAPCTLQATIKFKKNLLYIFHEKLTTNNKRFNIKSLSYFNNLIKIVYLSAGSSVLILEDDL